MVFSSHIFLFWFLPVFLGVYYLLQKSGRSLSTLNFWITLASYVFYGWFEPWFVVLMWVSTLVDYYCGRSISQLGASKFQRNFALTISMTVNLGMLAYFKYYMFFMGGLNSTLEIFTDNPATFQVMTVILPIGISFYTFQTMSYTIDVWRGDAPPVKDIRTFSAFVSLFPQLIAGPIIRYNTVVEQLSHRLHTLEKFNRGIILLSLGMAKKILLANPVGEIADLAFRADTPGMINAWWGALAYSFQIYFDFSAYSDMAVGLGLMIGFEFIKNFNAPYIASSMTDFWKRWHISLTKWFTDYLYISIGGNRVLSKKRLYFNLLFVMFMSGLWHGANWTFIVWGLFHAFFLIIERVNNRKALYHKFPLLFKILITQVIVVFSWVVFRAPDISQATQYWANMLGLAEVKSSSQLLTAQLFGSYKVFFMGLCFLVILQPLQAFEWSQKIRPYRLVLSLVALVLSLVAMFTQAFNPFLYFQF